MTQILFALLVTSTCFAVPKKLYDQSFKDYSYKYNVETKVKDFSAEHLAEIEKVMNSQKSKREIAFDKEANTKVYSEEFFESKMSPEFKKIRDEILLVKTGQELDEKLSFYDKNFDSLKENDSRLFIAQMIPLRAVRGIVWRLKPLVSDINLTHSLLLTMVKGLIIQSEMFLPSNQTKALTEFFTMPFVEDGQPPWVNKGEIVKAYSGLNKGGEAEVQAHVIQAFIPMLEKAVERIEDPKLLMKDWRVFDNRLWYGGKTFPDAMNRYALVHEVERQLALTNINAAIAEISYQAAYSWNGFMDMNRAISNLYGLDFVLSQVDGVPLEKRVKVIRSGKYKEWGMLRDQTLIDKSWKYLNKAVTTTDLAWRGMKNRPANELYLFDNSEALPFRRAGDLQIATIKSLMQGPKTVSSTITNEPVVVNLKGLFDNAPKDLKNMYPVKDGFKKAVRNKHRQGQYLTIDLKTNSGVVTEEYRDYTIGMGQEWDVSPGTSYKSLFPNVKNGSEDFIKHIRVLSQEWGVGGIAVPLSTYIQ